MRRLVGMVTISLAAVAVARAADTYPVRPNRPARPGDVCHVSFRVARTFAQVWTDPGTSRKPVHDAFTVTFDADETVDAVSRGDQAVKLTYKVARCERDGAPLLSLPAGAVVVADIADRKMTFTVNGTAATDDTAKALRDLIPSVRPDEWLAQRCFRADQSHKVGDIWPADREALARNTDLAFRVTPDDFTGQGKLLDVSVVDGRPTETVLLTYGCQADTRPGRSGQTFTNVKMSRDFTLSFPTDKPDRTLTAKSTFQVTYTVIDGSGTQAFSAEQRNDFKYAQVTLPSTSASTQPLPR